MNEITVSDHPVIQLELPGYSVLPVTLPLKAQGEGSGYIDNPIGGPLAIDLGPLVPIQYPSCPKPEKGDQGPTGRTGDRGPRGIQGNGKSAYEIWLEAGNVGTIYDFLRSLGFGHDLGSLIDMIRGPLDEELRNRLSEQDEALLRAQMEADLKLYLNEVLIHESNTRNSQAIADEALLRADALISLHGELEAAIIAESVTRSNEDEAYASRTELLWADFDNTMRSLVMSEAQARTNGDYTNAQQINLVNSRLNNGGDIATAMSTLRTSIDQTGDDVVVLAQSIDLIEANLASVSQTMEAKYDSISGKYNAAHTVTLNVDGHISGTKSENNGTSSSFSILASVFRVISSGSQGMEWLNGYLRSWGGNSQVVLGAPFGADNLMLFLGPNVGAGATSKASAGLWADASGNVGISGTVESSLLKTSALSIESTRIATGGGRLAPFTIRDSRYIVQNNTNASRTLVIGDFVSPHHGSGYHYMRFARNKMDVWIDVQISGDTGNETAIVEAQYDGGGWIQIQSVTFNCNYRGSFPIMFRYTTLESWNTLSIRVRTTQNRTEAMRITTDVANYNESGNEAGSNSGVAGGGGSIPPGGGGGGVPWCVDYETSVLPDGRFVRELAVGDLVACWDDDPHDPAITMLPVRAIGFGEEECFELEAGGATIIQSRSTPMTLRDGSTAYTADMLGKDVLVRDKHGHLRWEPVNRVTNVGDRRVVLMNAGDRMYFAGQDPDTTLATHNSTKPDVPLT